MRPRHLDIITLEGISDANLLRPAHYLNPTGSRFKAILKQSRRMIGPQLLALSM